MKKNTTKRPKTTLDATKTTKTKERLQRDLMTAICQSPLADWDVVEVFIASMSARSPGTRIKVKLTSPPIGAKMSSQRATLTDARPRYRG